jgi:carbonic anhydrase/acetyltransferase-like protein (isoleucine patch superfamily)
MSVVEIKTPDYLGHHFIPAEYLPEGKDEYHLRNEQVAPLNRRWRKLTSAEVEKLVQNSNTSDNWDEILVTDEFDPAQILNSQFFGMVRIGRLQNVILEHHDLRLPCGITDSLIAACDIGDDVAIHSVRYLAHYLIGDRCILANIGEMHTTDHAKFGNGILKDGEPESVRVWLDIMNEAGGRKVMPFDGMLPADAWLWAKYRDDKPLMEAFKSMTQNQFDSRRGYYGSIGNQCVIKNCRILKDVKIGSHGYIKGANKLKNITINSTEQEPTQIGEGVEIVNGIIGFGCKIFYGVKAVRFVLGNNSALKYGARLVNSYLGDNSTISCCEVLNNLIFPAHEQHHNNSFLIASVVMGQSNIAAGVTIGSNHNSRTNNNELQAGRGFWPGLCTSLKHPCRFASYVLLSKGDYPAELNIPLPFSLLNNNVAQDRLEIMPAFWWLHNMYALVRNSWKFQNRDKRMNKLQNIEFDAIAPDTVEEILHARFLIECWTAKAKLRQTGQNAADKTDSELSALGRELLNTTSPEAIKGLETLGENMEKSKRRILIIKPFGGYHAYGQMVRHYAVQNLLAHMQSNASANFDSLKDTLQENAHRQWVNLGGQLVAAEEADRLRTDIGKGKLSTWKAIHDRYDQLWRAYPLEKQRHAFAVLRDCYDGKLEKEQWIDALNRSITIQDYIQYQVYASRKKDHDNPFMQATYRNSEEMTATLGTVENDAFIRQVNEETEQFKQNVKEIIRRG